MRRAQSMSFDAIAATFLFVLIAVFGVIYAFNFFSGDASVTLTNEANALGDVLIRDLSGRADGTDRTVIDERLLAAKIEQGYELTRNELGVRSEFCVFFEDESGNIAIVVTDSGVSRAMFGSPDVLFNTTGTPISCDS